MVAAPSGPGCSLRDRGRDHRRGLGRRGLADAGPPSAGVGPTRRHPSRCDVGRFLSRRLGQGNRRPSAVAGRRRGGRRSALAGGRTHARAGHGAGGVARGRLRGRSCRPIVTGDASGLRRSRGAAVRAHDGCSGRRHRCDQSRARRQSRGPSRRRGRASHREGGRRARRQSARPPLRRLVEQTAAGGGGPARRGTGCVFLEAHAGDRRLGGHVAGDGAGDHATERADGQRDAFHRACDGHRRGQCRRVSRRRRLAGGTQALARRSGARL